MLRHHRVDAERARHPTILRQLLQILCARQRSLLLGHRHDFLAEVGKLLILVRLVERDDLFQRMHRRGGAEPRKIRVQIRFEFIEKDVELAVVELAEGRDVGRIDDHGALFLHVGDRGVGDLVGGGAVPEQPVPHDADARAPEAVGVEKR